MNLRYLENVATIALIKEKCIGCERCTEVCPHAVFDVADGKAMIADRDACMECGACALNCPEGAIEVNAGVGCAAAIIMSWITGEDPVCGCVDDEEVVDNKSRKCC